MRPGTNVVLSAEAATLIAAPDDQVETEGEVPTALAPMVGRRRERLAVSDVLRNPEVRLLVLTGPGGAARPEFRFPDHGRPLERDDMLLYGLEIAGPGGHWVEFSRPICAGTPSAETRSALEAYGDYFEAARATMRAGSTAHDVHRAVSAPFRERGFTLGHVTGHSIGMTMIEFPRVGEGIDVELRANMVVSMHPHAITADEQTCLYMQDTWLVTEEGGVPLSDVPLRIFDGSESRPKRGARPEPRVSGPSPAREATRTPGPR